MKLTVKKFSQLTPDEVYEILRSRAEVFVAEQKIICADPDGVDRQALHCFYTEGERVVAYLRAYVCPEHPSAVKIGRVLTLVRGQGYGRRIMEESLLPISRHFGCNSFVLNAQKHAEGFYEKVGFTTVSGEFLEEGVVHVTMERKLI